MKILVTGAAGFIGSHLSKSLLLKGHDLVLCDNFSEYYSPDLKINRVLDLLPNSFRNIQRIDLSYVDEVEKLIQETSPEIIVHLAAQPGVRLTPERYWVYLRDNVISFNNLMSVLAKKPETVFIYASSSSVYDDSANGPFNEFSTPLKPKSFYGLTKKWNEEQAKHFSGKTGLRTRGLRFFTVYGPWGRPDMAYFRLIAASLSQHNFTLFGDGTIKRDFTHIDDICERIEKLSIDLTKRNYGFSDVVNIGGQSPRSMLDLIEVVEEVSAVRISYASGDSSSADLRITEADKAYGNRIVGEFPYKPLTEGIKEFYAWASRPEVKSKLSEWIATTH